MTPRQWHGLAKLVVDAVVHGSSAVERAHIAAARRVFGLIELIPIVAGPAKAVHVVYDLSTRSTYATIRGTARVVGAGFELAFHALSPHREPDPEPDREDARA